MSGKLIGKIWGLKISPTAKYILVCIAEHANENGTDAFPSIRRIAWETGLNDRTVQRGLGRLKKLGVLEVQEHGGPGKGPNRYVIRLDKAGKQERFVPLREGGHKHHPSPHSTVTAQDRDDAAPPYDGRDTGVAPLWEGPVPAQSHEDAGVVPPPYRHSATTCTGTAPGEPYREPSIQPPQEPSNRDLFCSRDSSVSLTLPAKTRPIAVSKPRRISAEPIIPSAEQQWQEWDRLRSEYEAKSRSKSATLTPEPIAVTERMPASDEEYADVPF